MPDHPKKTNQRVAIGMEITRSRATIVLVDHHGKIHHRFYAKTLRGRPALATLEPYLRTLETALLYAKSQRIVVSGLGISIPGTLDLTARCPGIIPILPSLNGFPLCDLLEARYNLPAHLHVDVDAALLGEYFLGVGKGFRRLLFLNVNTVVGAATARYINIYEPDVLILGGDVLSANELLIANIQSSLILHSPSKTCTRLEVVPSRLGSDATLIGAGVPFLNISLTEQIESA